ncbi:hypothetical protein FOMA001_g9793 [Fusarium oxysporum f. sp. matthiolae]|nr:hypothetical protein FOMA001_g9793 [Fusarium oxysporum f. sp. matthiolae]
MSIPRYAPPGKLKLAECMSKVAAGENPKEPSGPEGTINQPAYSYPPDYSDTVDRLFKQAIGNGSPQKSGEISASAQNDSRDSSSGSRTSGGGTNFCWLRVQNNTSENWRDRSVTSSSEKTTVRFEVIRALRLSLLDSEDGKCTE